MGGSGLLISPAIDGSSTNQCRVLVSTNPAQFLG
jgi:hypothetical protein